MLIPGGTRLPPEPSELNPIATAVPTNSTATAVLITITAGRRYHGMIEALGSGAGCLSRSNFSCGRADVYPDPPPSTGMERESSPASDQANAGCTEDTGTAFGASSSGP